MSAVCLMCGWMRRLGPRFLRPSPVRPLVLTFSSRSCHVGSRGRSGGCGTRIARVAGAAPGPGLALLVVVLAALESGLVR